MIGWRVAELSWSKLLSGVGVVAITSQNDMNFFVLLSDLLGEIFGTINLVGTIQVLLLLARGLPRIFLSVTEVYVGGALPEEVPLLAFLLHYFGCFIEILAEKGFLLRAVLVVLLNRLVVAVPQTEVVLPDCFFNVFRTFFMWRL